MRIRTGRKACIGCFVGKVSTEEGKTAHALNRLEKGKVGVRRGHKKQTLLPFLDWAMSLMDKGILNQVKEVDNISGRKDSSKDRVSF